MTRLLSTGASALALLVGVAATSSPAEAASARCGMLLTGKAKMTRDLDCTGRRPIRLQGPKAHLDLNGFELTCGSNDRVNPLRLKGRGTLIRNGTLLDCTVEVLENGDHKLRSLTIENFDGAGVVISSNSNEVLYSSVTSDANGVVVRLGNFNLIADNDIFGAGAALIVQNRTYVTNNRLESGGGGVQVLGNFNRVTFNELLNTCIEEGDGIENLIGANVIDEELCNPPPEPEPEPEIPPPVETPPVEEPPVEEPPVEQPPVEEPPVEEPPVEQPPAEEPPIDEPAAE